MRHCANRKTGPRAIIGPRCWAGNSYRYPPIALRLTHRPRVQANGKKIKMVPSSLCFVSFDDRLWRKDVFFFTNKLAKKAALKGGKNSMLNYIEFCGEGFGRDVISADSSKIPLFTIPLFFVYFFQSFSPDGADSTFFKRTEHTHTQKSAHF